jgi:hypothetical protein
MTMLSAGSRGFRIENHLTRAETLPNKRQRVYRVTILLRASILECGEEQNEAPLFLATLDGDG